MLFARCLSGNVYLYWDLRPPVPWDFTQVYPDVSRCFREYCNQRMLDTSQAGSRIQIGINARLADLRLESSDTGEYLECLVGTLVHEMTVSEAAMKPTRIFQAANEVFYCLLISMHTWCSWLVHAWKALWTSYTALCLSTASVLWNGRWITPPSTLDSIFIRRGKVLKIHIKNLWARSMLKLFQSSRGTAVSKILMPEVCWKVCILSWEKRNTLS